MTDEEQRFVTDKIAVDAEAGVVSITFPFNRSNWVTVEFNPATAYELADSIKEGANAAQAQLAEILRQKTGEAR